MKITCRLLKNIAILFCSIFTVATIASCIINLLMGNTNDTYFHILDRAVLTLIGAIIIGIVRIKHLCLSVLITSHDQLMGDWVVCKNTTTNSC